MYRNSMQMRKLNGKQICHRCSKANQKQKC